MTSKSALENYFAAFRRNVIGHQQTFESPFGEKEIIYADWTASGRAYQPIEECIQKDIMPFLANTHTETTVPSRLKPTLRLGDGLEIFHVKPGAN
jgi:selenocysteine lyase/cysteine desulfurase